MKMRKRLAACILVLAQLTTFCIPVSAAEAETGYSVSGEVTPSGQLKVTISLQNVSAIVGRFALQFDQTKLELVGDSLATAIHPSEIVVTAEGVPETQLISQSGGYVMFAWYCSGSKIDAKTGETPIATIYFKLKDESTADFDGATLAMRSVKSGDCGSWQSGAFIRDDALNDYQNNVASSTNCAVSYSYPGSESVPDNAAQAHFTIVDFQGKPITAEIILGSRPFQTDSAGKAQCWLMGAQSYQVHKPGYETVLGHMPAEGGDIKVVLKNDSELVRFVADTISIGYAKGDSAARVTANISLPVMGLDKTNIHWDSSKEEVIASHGTVYRTDREETVVLTATVTKNAASAVKSFTVTVPAKVSGGTVSPPDKQISFDDLDDAPWAKEAILALANRGIIKGKTDTSFDPNGSITRGDFVTLLMRMLSPQGDTWDCFSDVPKNSYYYNEIAIAKSMGIAQGSGDNLFHPQQTITRQDMMTLTQRALVRMKLMPNSLGNPAPLDQFVDKSAIAGYAEKSVEAMVGCGIIQGSEGKILPNNSTTRAETAVMLYRISKTW